MFDDWTLDNQAPLFPIFHEPYPADVVVIVSLMSVFVPSTMFLSLA